MLRIQLQITLELVLYVEGDYAWSVSFIAMRQKIEFHFHHVPSFSFFLLIPFSSYNPLEMKILFTTMYTIYHLRKLLSSKFFLTTSMNNQLQKYLKRLTSLHGALERKASKFGNSKKRSLKAINLCLQELCYWWSLSGGG